MVYTGDDATSLRIEIRRVNNTQAYRELIDHWTLVAINPVLETA